MLWNSISEMLSVPIEEGALYYHETHRRERVSLTEGLRKEVKEMLDQMHHYLQTGYVPKVRPRTTISVFRQRG